MKQRSSVKGLMMFVYCTAAACAAPPITFVALSDELSPIGHEYDELQHDPRFAPDGRLVFPSSRALFAYTEESGVSLLIPRHEPVAPGIEYSPNSNEFTIDNDGRVLTLGGLFGSRPGLTYGRAGDLTLIATRYMPAPPPFEAHNFGDVSVARLSSDGVIIFVTSIVGENALWMSVEGQKPVLLASTTHQGLFQPPSGFAGTNSSDLAISAVGDIVWVGAIETEGASRLTIFHSDLSGTTTRLLTIGELLDSGEEVPWHVGYLQFPFQVNDSSIILTAFQSGLGDPYLDGKRSLYGTPEQYVPNQNALTQSRAARVLTSNGMAYSADRNDDDEFDIRRFGAIKETVLLAEGDLLGSTGDLIGDNLGDATANARGDVVFQCWVDHPDFTRTFALLHYHDDFGVRRVLFDNQLIEVRPGDLRRIINWSYIRNTGGVGGENSSLSEEGRLAFVVEFADETTGVAVADLTTSAPCPADFAEPFGVVDFFDVQMFLSLFAAGDLAADLVPAPGGDGVLSFFDLLEFLSLYAQGCP